MPLVQPPRYTNGQVMNDAASNLLPSGNSGNYSMGPFPGEPFPGNPVIASALGVLTYPNGMPLTGFGPTGAGEVCVLLRPDGGLLATAGGKPVTWGNGDLFMDGDSIYHHGGFGIPIVDGSGGFHAGSNGSQFADPGGNLYYNQGGSSGPLTDFSGNLYFSGSGTGGVLTDGYNLYTSLGTLLVDGSGILYASSDFYAADGNIVVDASRNVNAVNLTVGGGCALSNGITTIGGHTPVGLGVPVIVQSAFSNTGSAGFSNQNLVSGPSTGQYQANIYLEVTTAGTSGSTLQLTINFKDDVGVTSQSTIPLSITTTGRQSTMMYFRHLSGTNITYTLALVGTAGALKYNLCVDVMCTRFS